jgi:murein DD-endopeptidase MepM/ murein hydrolase activator NlpD
MALIFFIGITVAQDYRFPASDAHYGYFYPTAYKDDGGADWNCGSIYYSGHNGNDFGVGSWAGMDAGRAIVAAADGTVIATHDGEYDRCDSGDCGTGNYVKIQHANGRQTWYWHLKQWTVAVSSGQAVTCGTHLGYAGSSGNSTGPHIHFEVRESSNSASDPFDGPCSAPPTYWISQGSYGGLPGNSCPATYTGPCTEVATLSCGQTIASANNAGGATSSHSVYGCGEYASSGPEIAFAFSTPVSENVRLELTGLGADLDMFLLSSAACDGSGAISCSTNPNADNEGISFDAGAGSVYTVVIDGWEGAASGFSLTAVCTGGEWREDSRVQESLVEGSEPLVDSEPPPPGWEEGAWGGGIDESCGGV